MTGERKAGRRTGNPRPARPVWTARLAGGERGRARLVALALCPVLLLGAACHSYVRTEVPSLERGDRVRVWLSEPGAFRLGEVTAERVLQLEGEVVGWDDERLVLSAWWARSVSGREYAGEGLTVHVPRETMRDLEIRRLAALETGLVSAGGLAAALALGAVMRSGGGSGTGGGGGVPPQTGVGPASR